MAYYKYTVTHHYFSCDHELCVAQKGVTADSFTDAMAVAADEGWTFYLKRDGCPRHNAVEILREDAAA